MRSFRPTVLALLTIPFLFGCTTIQMRIGRKPNVELLENGLVLGKSTQEQVLAKLGPPVGGGRSRLPIDSTSRMMWTYYYEEGKIDGLTLVDDRRIFLFVFLEEGTYAGYLWFSSLTEHNR